MQANDELVKIKKFLPQYRQVAKLQRQLNDVRENYNIRKNGYVDTSKIENDAVLYSVSKIRVLFMAFILDTILSMILGSVSIYASALLKVSDDTNAILLGLSAIISLVLSLPLAWFIAGRKVRKQKREAQEIYEKRITNATEINKTLDELCSNLSREITNKTVEIRDLTAHIEKNQDSIVPKQYWYAADELYNLIDNGRADTVKEAINLYEDICHKQRLEDLTAQNAPVYDDHWYERELLKEQVEATKNVERQLDRMRWDLF